MTLLDPTKRRFVMHANDTADDVDCARRVARIFYGPESLNWPVVEDGLHVVLFEADAPEPAQTHE